MSDLISRSKLVSVLKHNQKKAKNENGETTEVAIDMDKMIEYIEQMPTAYDVMKVNEILLPSGRTGYECSNCGNELKVGMPYGNYCHWCGQKLGWEELR